MMRKIGFTVAAAAALFAFNTAELNAQSATGKTIEVKMVDVSATEFKFEPADITVAPGDVVKFVQTVATPHNVQFTKSPDGSNLGARAMGPFLAAPGATYEVTIDEGFAAGTHEYVCTPHAAMGMKGSITVKK